MACTFLPGFIRAVGYQAVRCTSMDNCCPLPPIHVCSTAFSAPVPQARWKADGHLDATQSDSVVLKSSPLGFIVICGICPPHR